MNASPSNRPRLDQSLELADGRHLAYAEWGDPGGPPVLFLHRSPGSRLFDPGADATAAVRLITVDRPGYGGTDRVSEPSFAAAAADLAALADALDLEDVALMGWSGGGQFAVAPLSALAGRVASLTLIVTPAPDEEIPWYPEESRPMMRAIPDDPAAAFDAMAGGLEPMMSDPVGLAASDPSPADAEVRALPGVLDALAEMMREAGRGGGAGTAFDFVAGGRGDALPLEAAQVPTHLWYAASDPNVGIEHGRWYEERIAESRLEVVADAGHLLPLVRWPEILAAAAGGDRAS